MRLSLSLSALLVVALIGCDTSAPESSIASSVADGSPWALPDGVVATAAPAPAVKDNIPLNVLEFDEVPFQPVDGLTVEGVTFSFEVDGAPSTNADYNSFGPNSGPFISCPCMEGDANGTLTLTFDKPTPVVEFGAVISTVSTLSPGYTVEVFGPSGQSRGVFEVDTAPAPTFSGALFRYDGAAAASVVVTFSTDSRFALDNLRYHVPPQGNA